MGIKTRILTDMKSAMSKGDLVTRRVTKMLLSEIQYAEDAMNAKLTEEMTLSVITSYYNRLKKTSLIDSAKKNKNFYQLQISIVAEYIKSFTSETYQNDIHKDLNHSKQLNTL